MDQANASAEFTKRRTTTKLDDGRKELIARAMRAEKAPGGANYSYTCNHCHHRFTGQHVTALAHLTGTRFGGCRVKACLGPSTDDHAEALRIVDAANAIKQAQEAAVHLLSSDGEMLFATTTTPAQPEAKKAKTSKSDSTKQAAVAAPPLPHNLSTIAELLGATHLAPCLTVPSWPVTGVLHGSQFWPFVSLILRMPNGNAVHAIFVIDPTCANTYITAETFRACGYNEVPREVHGVLHGHQNTLHLVQTNAPHGNFNVIGNQYLTLSRMKITTDYFQMQVRLEAQ